MSNVLTVVFDKAEVKLDSVIAAAVNELHSLGHVVKEVRVMGDSGEAKIALNTVEGILPPAIKADIATGVKDAGEIADVLDNKGPDGTSPVAHTSVPDDTLPQDVPPSSTAAPTGTPVVEENEQTPGEQTIAEKRLALLDELDALDKEEEASISTSTATEAASTVDPTNSGGSLLTNPEAVTGS